MAVHFLKEHPSSTGLIARKLWIGDKFAYKMYSIKTRNLDIVFDGMSDCPDRMQLVAKDSFSNNYVFLVVDQRLLVDSH